MTDPTAPQPKSKTRRYLTFAIKLVVTGLALYIVSTKIDFAESLRQIAQTNPLWFIAAILVFNGAKIVSTLRLRAFVEALGITLPHGYNIRLYYIGAFYNLFLPGSIGGDAYKVYLLKQKYEDLPTRKFISAALLDRVSGVAALFTITFSISLMTVRPLEGWVLAGLIAALVCCYPAYYIVLRYFFNDFLPKFWYTNIISLGVQLTMLGFGTCLLMALGVEENLFNYLVLFMLASVISVIPVTVGGLGAREATFLIGERFLAIDTELATAMALMVFITLAISAFPGLLFSWLKNE